jgi:uncharacterized protein with von Willebrand factor type A (vWA) domain
LAPVQTDVRALHDELTAQNEALAGLSRSIERLRRRIPTEAPAARPTKA